jgi:hypothetical protein
MYAPNGTEINDLFCGGTSIMPFAKILIPKEDLDKDSV